LKETIKKNISPELEDFMKKNKLSNIGELLAIAHEDLLQMDDFGWRMMKEVLSLRKVV
jgi:hypothetical protein